LIEKKEEDKEREKESLVRHLVLRPGPRLA
jgi:hypothetical protein